MKWQAVHFFKPAHGLSRHEPIEMAACLDYEQALKSKRLVDLVVSLLGRKAMDACPRAWKPVQA